MSVHMITFIATALLASNGLRCSDFLFAIITIALYQNPNLPSSLYNIFLTPVVRGLIFSTSLPPAASVCAVMHTLGVNTCRETFCLLMYVS